MGPPRDLVAFVVRSENRLTALETLVDGPRTRREAEEASGIARATLNRIFGDFEHRDLLTRTGHEYELTPLGQRLAAALDDLFASVGSMQSLQTVSEWVPLAELDSDIEDLSSVAVTLPTQVDPMRPVKRAAEVIEGAELVRGFCYSVVHAPILVECRNVVERGKRFEGVIAAPVLEVVASDPDLVERLRTLFENSRAAVYIHEGAIEPQLILADGTTLFLVADEQGAIRGLVELGDESVHAWAVERFEAIRDAAQPLDPDAVADLLTA